MCFLSFQEVLYSYPDGWFFAIFQKSESVDINLHEFANQTCNSFTINPVVCKSVSKDSCSTKEVKLDQKVTNYKKDNRVRCNNYMKCYRKQPEVKAKNNAYMQKYRAKTYSELDLNERGKLEIRKRNENQRNDLEIKFTMKRKSQSINSSSDTYYADENIKRPKQEIRKRSSQTSSEVKERKKLYMRAYRLKKKIQIVV